MDVPFFGSGSKTLHDVVGTLWRTTAPEKPPVYRLSAISGCTTALTPFSQRIMFREQTSGPSVHGFTP
jgi:hypothetical protein